MVELNSLVGHLRLSLDDEHNDGEKLVLDTGDVGKDLEHVLTSFFESEFKVISVLLLFIKSLMRLVTASNISFSAYCAAF